jgi:hypothetical protein
MFGCRAKPECLVFNRTTSRLHENWYSCMPHVTRVIAFIVERDAAWGEPTDKVVVQELQLS